MHLSFLSRLRYAHHILWTLLLSALIVSIAATVGRASVKLRGALTADDGSLAVMLLLPEKGISSVKLLKASSEIQEFVAQTKTGPELIRLKRGPKQWFVLDEVTLHE